MFRLNECSICTDTFASSKRVIALVPCGACIHQDCYDNYVTHIKNQDNNKYIECIICSKHDIRCNVLLKLEFEKFKDIGTDSGNKERPPPPPPPPPPLPPRPPRRPAAASKAKAKGSHKNQEIIEIHSSSDEESDATAPTCNKNKKSQNNIESPRSNEEDLLNELKLELVHEKKALKSAEITSRCEAVNCNNLKKECLELKNEKRAYSINLRARQVQIDKLNKQLLDFKAEHENKLEEFKVRGEKYAEITTILKEENKKLKQRDNLLTKKQSLQTAMLNKNKMEYDSLKSELEQCEKKYASLKSELEQCDEEHCFETQKLLKQIQQSKLEYTSLKSELEQREKEYESLRSELEQFKNNHYVEEQKLLEQIDNLKEEQRKNLEKNEEMSNEVKKLTTPWSEVSKCMDKFIANLQKGKKRPRSAIPYFPNRTISEQEKEEEEEVEKGF